MADDKVTKPKVTKPTPAKPTKPAPAVKATKTPKPPPAQDKVKGPASYFPSIEARYGRPISEWQALIRSSPLTGHMELVRWLKDEHGLGHGHANALVAHTLAEDKAG